MRPSATPKRVTILTSDNRVVGTATLRWEDMGVHGGEFGPAPPYSEIRHVFLAFARAAQAPGRATGGDIERYYSERDARRPGL